MRYEVIITAFATESDKKPGEVHKAVAEALAALEGVGLDCSVTTGHASGVITRPNPPRAITLPSAIEDPGAGSYL